jgi:lactoylglutathione lyase
MGMIEKIHHVAYRCKNAKQTVEWYRKYLDMDYLLAFAEDYVPSTKAHNPYMHIFLDAGNGNVLAFFELAGESEMGRDPNTPDWVQHLAFQVDSVATLEKVKAKLEADGIPVVGITDHTLFKSIYFFDPNGHRLELAVDTSTPELVRRAAEVKTGMLDEWDQTKKAPKQARWLHDGSAALQ